MSVNLFAQTNSTLIEKSDVYLIQKRNTYVNNHSSSDQWMILFEKYSIISQCITTLLRDYVRNVIFITMSCEILSHSQI